MGRKLENGQSCLELAAEASKLLVQQKLILVKTHEVGVIVVGSEETENDLADKFGGYKNISVIQELSVPSADSLRVLSGLSPTEAAGDILDATIVAVSMISEHCKKKKFLKRVYILTDGNSPIEMDEQLEQIANQINFEDITINILAVGWGPDLKPEQEYSEAVFKQLTSMVKGTFKIVKKPIDVYKKLRKRNAYPVAKYKGAFDLGLGHCLQVAVYGKTKEETLMSLKKHSTAVDFSYDAKEALVKMSRELALEDDPTAEAVDAEDVTKAFYYGSSVVPVSADEEALLKYPTERCLVLLGYLPYAEVPREFFMGGVDVVLPQANSEQAFRAFVYALEEEKNAAIARYNSRENQAPKLAVLTPHISDALVCLWLNLLPTAEELRDFPFADMRESTKEQQKSAEKFIRALDLGDGLDPRGTFNPTIQFLYQCLSFRVENPEEPLPPLDPNIAEYLCPDRVLFEQAEKEFNEFASKFELIEVEQPKKTKQYYSDIIKQADKDENMSEDEDLFVSEANPIQDFRNMLKDRKKDRVADAIAQMKDAIRGLVEKAFRGNTHQKAIECLIALREGCLEEEEIAQFNAFLTELKQGDHQFWNTIVAAGISLITSLESERSNVSAYEAAAFLVKLEEAAPVEEDILDDID